LESVHMTTMAVRSCAWILKAATMLATVFFAGTLLAQDLPDFAQVSGFQLPSLRSGQYMLNFQPRYQYGPLTDSSWSSFFGGSGIQLTTASTQKRLQFKASVLYGIDDETTVLLELSSMPRQLAVNSFYASQSTSVQYWRAGGAVRTGYAKESALFSQGLVTLRPRAGVEWSLGAYYGLSHTPFAGWSGQEETSPYPFEPGSGRMSFPSFPEIFGAPFEATYSFRGETFGIHAGLAFVTGKELTLRDVRLTYFALPSLYRGRLIGSLVLRVERQPQGRSRLDQSIFDFWYPQTLYLSGFEAANVTTSCYSAEASFAYGISDAWTTSLGFHLAPDQSSAEKSGTSRYDALPWNFYYRDWTSSLRSAGARVDWKLALRPDPGLELSIGTRYWYARWRRNSGSTASYLETDMGGHSYDQERARSTVEGAESSFNVALISTPEQLKSVAPLAGFRLPVIPRGEFAASGRVAFEIERSNGGIEGTASWGFPRLTEFEGSSWRQPALTLGASFLFGLSEVVSAAISIEGSPAFMAGTHAFTFVNYFGVTTDSYAGSLHREVLSSLLTLAYRPLPGMEISLLASYQDLRTPSSGVTNAPWMPLTYPENASARRRVFNFEAGITLLNP
jgi:hypothetical protein